MHTIDFTTALGRLLRDGALRDLFRASVSSTADELNVRAEDRAAFMTMSAAELDAQADVLLRKRLDRVKHLAPELCSRLGENLWLRFREYARLQWPDDASRDALDFYEHLSLNSARDVSRTELNRLRFMTGTARFRVSIVRLGNCRRSGLQILRRRRNGSVGETWLYLAVTPIASR